MQECARNLFVMLSMGSIGWMGTGALAHDFWVAPSRYRPAAHARLAVKLLVGESFAGEGYARNPRHIERFALIGPDVERDVVGAAGSDPAGSVQVGAAGTYVIGYRSHRSRVELPADEFEAYLAHEGLQHVVEARKTCGESDEPGRELFSRCAKSLLRVGERGSENFDRPLGFPLEIVTDRDPYDLAPGAVSSVRVLYRGKPLRGALVTGHHTPGSKDVVQGRTDADGRVRLSLTRAGAWLLNTVHMVRAAEGQDAEWESFWASLTFELPASPPRPE